MSKPGKRTGLKRLAAVVAVGILAALGATFAGSAWTAPWIAAITVLIAAAFYIHAIVGLDKASVDSTQQQLWVRYTPKTAAGSATNAVKTAVAKDGQASEAALKAIDELNSIVSNAEGDGDRALAYVERVIDRQINKLRGVLSFDALIIAFLSVERGRIGAAPAGLDYDTGCVALLTVVLFLLVVSSVMCLDLFRVVWSSPENFRKFETEHKNTVSLVADRTKIVERAVRLSEIAVVGAVTCFVLIEFETVIVPPAAATSVTTPTKADSQMNDVERAASTKSATQPTRSQKAQSKVTQPARRARPVE